MNINMSNPQMVSESGTSIIEATRVIDQAIETIKTTVNSLESWQSDSKTKFETVLSGEIPKMEKLSEVLKSYGGVARQAGSRIIAAENEISRVMNN